MPAALPLHIAAPQTLWGTLDMPLAVTTSSTTRPKTQPALPPRAVLLCSAQILLLDQLLLLNTAARPTIARPIAATHCYSSHSKPATQGSATLTLPKLKARYLLCVTITTNVTSNTATRPTQSPLPRAVLLCSAQLILLHHVTSNTRLIIGYSKSITPLCNQNTFLMSNRKVG